MTFHGPGPPAVRLLALLLAGLAGGIALRPLPPRDAAPAAGLRGGDSRAAAAASAPDAALCLLLAAGPAHAHGAPRLAWHAAVLRAGTDVAPAGTPVTRPPVEGTSGPVEPDTPVAGVPQGGGVAASPDPSAAPPDPPAPPGAVERAFDLAIARRDDESRLALERLPLEPGSAAAYVRALASARSGAPGAGVLLETFAAPGLPLACRVPAALEAARAHAREGDAARALRLLARLGTDLPEIGDHVAAWSVEALAAAAGGGVSPAEALALAEPLHRRATGTASRRSPGPAARRADRARAVLLLAAGQPSRARAILAGLMPGAPRADRPALLAELAQLDARLGEPARGAGRLRTILERHAESDEALALLAPPRSPERPLLRPSVRDSAAVLAARGLTDDAVRALTPASDAVLLELRGGVRFRAGDYPGAAADYAEAIARGGSAAPLRMELAKAYARAGEVERARGVYRALLDAEPSGRRAPTLTYLIADLFQEQGLADSAAGWFRRLGERWPRADLAPRGLLRLGHLEFARGRTAAAEEAYRGYLARHPGGGDRREARYWLARALAESGRDADARDLYAELIAPAADDWYAILARRRLGGSPASIAATVFGRERSPDGGTGDGGADAAGALPRNEGSVGAASALGSPADTVLQAGPEVAALRRARALLLAGETAAAAYEVDAAAHDGGGDPAALRRVARWALARGFPETTFRLGSALLAADPSDHEADALAHAAAFPALVRRESAEHAIPASLVWAVARRESRFDPAARSPAGATGLLQLMPATARDEAARARLASFDPSDLRRPEANLHLGAAHLRRLLDEAGGRWEVALAAYNAGAQPVRRWTAFPESRTPEGFVERIPFRETRAYVKLVLAARARYEELHGR